jgi:hypothetical protein
MVEGRHSNIKVKDQLTTVVELHDGRSAVLPYPGYEVCFRIQSLLSESDDQPVVEFPHPGGWLEAPFLMAN